MSTRSEILDRFIATGLGGSRSPLLLLDLTLWHKWHRERGTLPAGWGPSVVDTARALATPIWAPFRPWRVEHEGIEVSTDETEAQRDVKYRALGRTLLARWTRGPDGDWWQTEYPVKSPEDLEAAVEIAACRRYAFDAAGFDKMCAAVGDDGIVPVELPMRPYSDVLHTMVGWGEGLALLMGEDKPLVNMILTSLEDVQARLVAELAKLKSEFLLAPDNMDGQYISPRAFKEFMAPGYRATAASAHRCDKQLVVHVGGPVKRLVPLLAEAGVDGIEGIAGPPQADTTLSEGREAAGPGVTLWGGISQDLLLEDYDDEAFEAGVQDALQHARDDATGRTIVGVADRVPVGASVERLRRLVEMVR